MAIAELWIKSRRVQWEMLAQYILMKRLLPFLILEYVYEVKFIQLCYLVQTLNDLVQNCTGHKIKNQMLQFKIAHDVLFREVMHVHISY